MQNPNPSPDPQHKKWLLIAGSVLLAAVIFLSITAGIVIGRVGMQPDTKIETTIETITEIQEVTRVVEVVVTATPGVTLTAFEQVAPSDGPAEIETVLPGSLSEGTPTVTEELDFSTFNETWELINREFDGELPEDKTRLYAAISGSLQTLDDQYTRFFRPDLAERLREDLSGSVSGIGAFVRENSDGLIEITRPIDGQPADLAGILSGDIIIAVDGESVVYLGSDEVLSMVRGPEGTPVTLTIVRQDSQESLDFTIVRTVYEVPVIVSEIIDREGQRIAYIRLTSFTRSADQALQDALDELLIENPQGLIFDLRDNGGGLLDQAISVADTFLPDGIILYERNSKGDIDKTFTSKDGDRAEEIPMVVLVNGGSASASEIVAGAIQDLDRGVLIGETTFGKGSVQLVHTLADRSELRVTIARWFTPDNKSISENGITPDIVEPNPADLGGDNDNQLQRAIDYLINGE